MPESLNAWLSYQVWNYIFRRKCRGPPQEKKYEETLHEKLELKSKEFLKEEGCRPSKS